MPEEYNFKFSPEHEEEKPHKIEVKVEDHEDDDHEDVHESIGTNLRISKEEAERMRKALKGMN